MPPPSEASLGGSPISLPEVYGEQGQERSVWADASLVSRVAAGQAQLRKKDYAAARSSFSIARTLDRNHPEARIGLIQVSLMVRNYFKATQMIRELGRRAPEIFSTEFDVERWHESQEQYDEFLRRFREQIVDTREAGEMVRVLMGYVAWTTGDREQALSHMKLATAEVPQEKAWVNIIRSLSSPGKAKRPARTTSTVSGGGTVR